MKKLALLAPAAVAFGLAACSSDSSSSSASSDFYESKVTVDEAHSILSYTITEKGACFYEDGKLSWNTSVDSDVEYFKYDVRKDTLILYESNSKGKRDSDYGTVYVGGGNTLYGTWTSIPCVWDYDEDESVCDEEENARNAFDSQITISSSGVSFNYKLKPDFPYIYSTFMVDVFRALDGRSVDASDFHGSELFYMYEKTAKKTNATFTDDYVDIFLKNSETEASFSIGKKKYSIVVANPKMDFSGNSGAVTIANKDGKSCKFEFNATIVSKSYCSEKYMDGLELDHYSYDEDDEEYYKIPSYEMSNDDEFLECLLDL